MASYRVTFAPLAARQFDSIPPAAQGSLTQVLERIAANPDLGRRYSADHPPGMRIAPFGDWGVVVYLIRTRARQIAVLDITWAH